MEYVPGKSVEDIILGYPGTSEYVEAIDINQVEKDLIAAVKLLHANGIKHQDITVRNIMFDIESGRPVIIDLRFSHGLSFKCVVQGNLKS